jgi:hypothetical protein
MDMVVRLSPKLILDLAPDVVALLLDHAGAASSRAHLEAA